MITATLHAPAPRPEVPLELFRAANALARREQTKILLNARKRAKRYARKVREAGYRDGHAQGLLQSTREFSSAMEALRNQYKAAIDQAHEDVSAVAHQIVEHIIPSYVRQNPEQLREWISLALENLKHTRGLTLRYHPRYHDLLAPFIEESREIMRSVRDPSLGERDFCVATDAGEITFAWREVLRQLSDRGR